ncbi:hypothetical protein P0227_21150, partial [Enterobacter cloacae]|uniref:hypothetical protein n=1 Tax=Enterobacter cloacae TaxID=550 RepID=UPI0034DA2BC6
MYSYHDVEAIKTNLEWIVNQATLNQASPTRADQKALFDLLELIQSYEILLDLIGNDSNLLIVFYVQIMPDDFVMQLHR